MSVAFTNQLRPLKNCRTTKSIRCVDVLGMPTLSGTTVGLDFSGVAGSAMGGYHLAVLGRSVVGGSLEVLEVGE